ncbi:MAG: mutA [Ignavibacteria bacterium]|nr:mutA [Ignavibacteria bacterium]
MDSELNFNEFPKPDFSQWREAAEAALKDGKFYEMLFSDTYEGISIKPLYMPSDIDGQSVIDLFKDSKTNSWEICPNLYFSDSIEFNTQALNEIQGGATALNIIIVDAYLEDINRNSIPVMFRDIKPESVSLNFYFNELPIEKIECIIEFLANCGAESGQINGSICFDIVNFINKNNSPDSEIKQLHKKWVELFFKVKSILPNFGFGCIDARLWKESGGSAVEELALSLSAGAFLMNNLADYKIDIDDIASKLSFHYSVSSDFFMEIAKFKAARVLWQMILTEFGASEITANFKINASTAFINKSTLDSHVNILRTATEAMSAIIGGANAITINPFDAMNEQSGTDFSRRLARTALLVLKHESNLNQTTDAATGTYYIEALTKELISRAWELFLKIESEGGFIDCYKKGILSELISNIREKRLDDINKINTTLLGVNKYPLKPDEAFVKKFLNLSGDNEAEIPEEINPVNEEIGNIRLSNGFEEVRKNSGLYKIRTGSYPLAFILNYGTYKDYSRKSKFASDFFSAGGFEIVQSQAITTIEDATQKIQEFKSNIIIICTSDFIYNEIAKELIAELKKNLPKAKLIFVASSFGGIEQMRSTGIDEIIFKGVDAIKFLQNLQILSGII